MIKLTLLLVGILLTAIAFADGVKLERKTASYIRGEASCPLK